MVEHKTRTGQLRTLRRPAQQLSLVLAKSEMEEDTEDEDHGDLDDDDDDEHGPGGEQESPEIDAAQQPGGQPIRGPPITLEQLLGHDDEQGEERDVQVDDNLQNDNFEDAGGEDEHVATEEEQVENVNSIQDVDTDQESQPKEDSDGDDIEEELDSGPFTAVNDNIKTRPALKVKVPGAPKKNEKIVDIVKKPKPVKEPKSRGRKKRKD